MQALTILNPSLKFLFEFSSSYKSLIAVERTAAELTLSA